MPAPPKTQYVRDGDVHIAWQEIGDGPIDVLVAPGFISHLDLNWTHPAFATFVEHLARFSRVILFDKRGTGLSDHAADADRFERRMADIELVLDAAGSRHAVLMGLSEGGPLASLFAATRPDRVESLVLIGTFARGSVIPIDVLERFEHAVDNWGEGHTAGIFLAGSDGPVVRRFTALFERAAASPGVARRLLRSIASCDVTGVLPAVHTPALILHRTDDPFALTSWSDEIETLLPNSTRVELPGSDHLPWMGDGPAMAIEIEEWVTGRRPVQAPGRSRFAAVLFSDIVASTQQAATAGDSRWSRLIQSHNDVCRDLFAIHDGWAVKSTGDGFVSCFDRPEAAVRCAVDLHRTLEGQGIEIRVGLHCGEVERVDSDDVAGIAVNIAARVCASADAASTLATQVFADQLVGSDIGVESVGTHQLRGVPGSVALVRLTAQDIVIDLRELEDERVTGGITLELARRSPGLVRGLARLSGAR